MRISRLKKIVVLSFLCSALLFSVSSIANTVNTKFSRDTITLDDTVTITYTLNSDAPTGTPSFSALETDFHILGTNYGSVVNMINGVVTKQTIWQLTLQPKKTGTIPIPAIQFGSDASSPQQIVVAATANTNSQDKSNSSPFVQAEVNNSTPYVQGQIVYKLKLFYQTRLDNPRIELPQLQDAVLMELDGGNQYQTTIKGNTYLVVEKNIAIFPKKSGKLIIPPTHFSAYSYDSNTLLNDHFYIAEPKAVNLSTKELTIDVQKVPASFQGANWLPAKKLVLSDEWSVDSNLWEAGNPVTRTVIITAQGLRADQIPDFVFEKIDGITLYVDPPKRNNQIKDESVIGTLEQKVTYIPNTSRSFSLPALKLYWWNTTTNTQALAQLGVKSIQVKGQVSNTLPPSTITVATPSQAAKTVLSVKHEHEQTTRLSLFYLSIWFWVAVFFFIVWLMTLWVLIWRKKPTSAKASSAFLEPHLPALTIAKTDEKSFQKACEQGNAAIAQQYLLAWAKKEYHNNALNLDKLSELISDNEFKHTLKELELTIYAKQSAPWNGLPLLMGYQKLKKSRKHDLSLRQHLQDKKHDPLPPLHPKST